MIGEENVGSWIRRKIPCVNTMPSKYTSARIAVIISAEPRHHGQDASTRKTSAAVRYSENSAPPSAIPATARRTGLSVPPLPHICQKPSASSSA